MDKKTSKNDSRAGTRRQRAWRAAHRDLDQRRKAATNLYKRIRKDYKHFPLDVNKPRSGQFHYAIGTPKDPEFKDKPGHELKETFIKRRLAMVFDDLPNDRRLIYYRRCKKTGVHGYLLVNTEPATADDETHKEFKEVEDSITRTLDFMKVPPPLRGFFKVVRILDIHSCVFSDYHLFTGWLDLTPFSVNDDHTLKKYFDLFESFTQELRWGRRGLFQFITLSPLSPTDLVGLKSYQYRVAPPEHLRSGPLWAIPHANAMVPDGPITESFEERIHFWYEYLLWKRSGLFLPGALRRALRMFPWLGARLETLIEYRKKQADSQRTRSDDSSE